MEITFDALCAKGQHRHRLLAQTNGDLHDAVRKLQAAEDDDYPTTRHREHLIASRQAKKNAEIELHRHVAHCTDGCKRAPDGGFGARATLAGAYSRSPSHKEPMPGGGELAARLRDGASLAELAVEYDRVDHTLRSHIVAAGYSSITGEPNHKARNPLALILGRVDDQPWAADALCAQTDPESFYPEKGGSTREAKQVCASCLVQAECLDYALDHDERFGIWGGLSERERRKIKQRQPIAPGRHVSGLTCALDGCDEPTTKGDTGRPRKYCTPEHKHLGDTQPLNTQEKAS